MGKSNRSEVAWNVTRGVMDPPPPSRRIQSQPPGLGVNVTLANLPFHEEFGIIHCFES